MDVIQGLLHMLQLPCGKPMVYGNHHPTHECLERRLHCEGGWGEAMMWRERYNSLSELCNTRSDLQGPAGNNMQFNIVGDASDTIVSTISPLPAPTRTTPACPP